MVPPAEIAVESIPDSRVEQLRVPGKSPVVPGGRRLGSGGETAKAE
jgi:hypothetical protein